LGAAIEQDPEAFLGPAHVSRYGSDLALLVKLLDAGERLPVHCHPDRAFAARHLGSPHGKTEAWVIVEAGPGAAVGVGFKEEVERETLATWVARQEVDSMLEALHRIPVAPGDALFIPAGLPHVIGETIFLVELQEPSDLSVLLEWQGFAIDGAADGHLGLGFDVALEAVDRSRWTPDRIEWLSSRRAEEPADGGMEALFPPESERFFRAERIRPQPFSALPAELSILVAIAGEGRLTTPAGDELTLARGDTVLVPWSSGRCALEGRLEVIRCMPPSPA
jgi:mannose-6-phosphate isomerase